MQGLLRFENVRLVAATADQRNRGLLGWVSCTVNGVVQLSGLTLRRTLQGKLTLSFPAKRDGHGREHFFIRPLDDATRRDIEHQVFQALGIDEETRR